MSEFHSPYQFVKANSERTKKLHPYPPEKDALKTDQNAFVRHDYWHNKGYSGRIRCTLKAESPLVIGAEQISGMKAPRGRRTELGTVGTVLPYLDHNENPAIPASSLRGMVSSIAETISQSALRVLVPAEKGEYSVRKPAQSDGLGKEFAALKHIGVLHKTSDGYKLYTLTTDQHEGISVGDYLEQDKYDKCCEAKQRSNRDIQCPSKDRHRKYAERNLIINRSCYHHKHQPTPQLDAYSSHPQGVYYIRGRNDALCKRSELFIPWDGNIDETQTLKLLDIADDVIEQLETILRTVAGTEKDIDQRKKKQRQMLPEGYAEHSERVWELDPKKERAEQPLVLEGDLLYYREEQGKVVELSYSSIWRKAVQGSLHDAFINSAGENSVPWSKDRNALTPAEALFGVVEEQKKGSKPHDARNLASRVRFTDAVSEKAIALPMCITLKILNSPKPPSPAMYFSSATGQYVAKTELNLDDHAPNGRKYYLPHPRSLQEKPKEDWRTKNPEHLKRPHMHLQCSPIPKNSEFTFDVYFENLSKGELGLLQTALQPTSGKEKFIHRLGLGKAIGLGHVSISTRVETIDRTQCYSVNSLITQQPRYTERHETPDMSLVDEEEALPQFLHLSNPENLATDQVCYPFHSDKNQTAYSEEKGFQWFTNNDRTKKYHEPQYLESVTLDEKLPTLKS